MKRTSVPDLRPVLDKTLAELEGSAPKQSTGSYVIETVHRLYSLPIGRFSVEDLRIMLGQRRGVAYLLPLALQQLEDNPLAEGDFYEGDLLLAALDAGSGHWKPHSIELRRAVKVARQAAKALERLETTEDHRESVRRGIEKFLANHAPGS